MKKIQAYAYLFSVLVLCSNYTQAQDFIADSFMSGGINSFAKTDLNNDGLVDLVGLNYKFVGPTDLEMLMNSSDTSIVFESTIIASSEDFNGSPAVGDLDGDGDVDIAVSIDMDKQIVVYKNNGDNTFTEEASGLSGVNQLQMVDLEGDGDMDLIGYIFDDNIISTFINDGDGNLSDGSTTEHANDLSSIDCGDIDDDGDIDFVLSVDKFSGETIAIYLNDSLNNYDKLSSFDINALNSALQVKMVDINQDGKLDVLGLNDEKITAFLQNDIFGFIAQDIIAPSNAGDLSAFDVADFDGDGDLDFVIGDLTADLYWYKNVALVFAPQMISTVRPINNIAVEDFDGDGDIDFVVTNGDFRAYRNVIEQMPSSLEEIPQDEIMIFPNPSHDRFEIRPRKFANYTATLYDMNGQLLIRKQFSALIEISTANLASGIYNLQVYDEENQRLSIQKLTKI